MDSQDLQKIPSPNVYDQRNISEPWMEVWSEIENWYGDPMKRESGQELLERLQKAYDLRDNFTPKAEALPTDEDMRYFNVEQHGEPKSMFSGERKVDISELEQTAKEITEEQAMHHPKWGSGNISVDKTGNWKWKATNHDTSG